MAERSAQAEHTFKVMQHWPLSAGTPPSTSRRELGMTLETATSHEEHGPAASDRASLGNDLAQALTQLSREYLEQRMRRAHKHRLKYLAYPYYRFVAHRIAVLGHTIQSLAGSSVDDVGFVRSLVAAGSDWQLDTKARHGLVNVVLGVLEHSRAEWLDTFTKHTGATPTLSSRIACFYAHQRGLDLENAFAIGRSLSLDPRLSPKQRRKLASEPAMHLEALEWLPASSPPRPRVIRNRIAYVAASSLPYSLAGYTTRTHGVARGYRRIGFDIHVITRPGFPLDTQPALSPTDIPAFEEIEGIPHHRLLGPTKQGHSPAEYVRLASAAIERTLSELQPEIVIAGSNHANSLPSLIAARRLGLPFVYEVRGMWELSRASREPDYINTPDFKVSQMLETFVASRADKVLTLTDQMMRNLIARGVDPSRIALMPNGVDEDAVAIPVRNDLLASQLGLPNGVPVIGYVGSIVEYEGLTDLARACVGLADRGVLFALLLVGEERPYGNDIRPITQEIQRLFSEARIQDRLFLPGRVPFSEVQSYYSLIDIAPIPRRPYQVSEMVSPIKPVEALAMGKTLVVSDVEALLDFVQDGRTGLSFRKGDPSDLEAKLALAIQDKGLRERLSRNGLDFVRSHRTWPRICEHAAAHMGLLHQVSP